ncbi:MAG TPA: prepilin-type N-terminal cleavage/methylation domain-containing protein [Candidatus Saccharimonadales bacterium]|nr:prepilin-type N-terminal cleavage/methylation domain-containing protein [Candidatus Saccharimonadales bacterium]
MDTVGTHKKASGYTLVELVISMTVLAIVALGVLSMFTTLAHSAAVTKRKAIASTLATNQMEYLKSLPYDSLAIAGGSIYSANPLPGTTTKTYNGVVYTIKTSINYVDDAYDGCATYPTPELKNLYCRNLPSPSGAPAVDTNPADYKIVHVSVYAPTDYLLAEVDTQISARVAETASTTGALFVTIIDDTGTPVSGATVQVANTTITPNINASDTSDSNGVAIFYGLPPDTTGYSYIITASKANYSSLTTIAPSGSQQPTYPSQQIITQQSSSVTLTIKPQGNDSLLVETTDTNGAPLGGAQIYIKGGYKRYTSTSDTSYYYDNMSPDTRPTTDAGGQVGISSLVPGNYIFCGDLGSTGCRIGSTTYYLAAALPYGGSNSLNPITVPTWQSASPPATTYPFGGVNYYQKVRLMLTSNPNFPRVFSVQPDTASVASGLSSFQFTLTGRNLPCSGSPASCATTVNLIQGATTFPSSCTGSGTGDEINCTADLSAATNGALQLQVISGGNTLNLPTSPLGGINVTP